MENEFRILDFGFWIEHDDGRSCAAVFGASVEEVEHRGVDTEPSSHLGAPNPFALSVNDSHFTKALSLGRHQIIEESFPNIFRPERVKVEGVPDRDVSYLQSKIENPKSNIVTLPRSPRTRALLPSRLSR